MTSVTREAAAAFAFDPPMEPRAWPGVLGASGEECGGDMHTVAELEEASGLVGKLLVYSPSERISASEALKLAFFGAPQRPDKVVHLCRRDADAPASSCHCDAVGRRRSAIECGPRSWPEASS